MFGPRVDTGTIPRSETNGPKGEIPCRNYEYALGYIHSMCTLERMCDFTLDTGYEVLYREAILSLLEYGLTIEHNPLSTNNRFRYIITNPANNGMSSINNIGCANLLYFVTPENCKYDMSNIEPYIHQIALAVFQGNNVRICIHGESVTHNFFSKV